MFFQEELMALVKSSNLKEFLLKQTISNVNENKIPPYPVIEYILQCDILLKPNLQKKKKKHYVQLHDVILLFKKGKELGTFYYTRIFI